ncbi:NAD(P)-dependent oxidoreductase [Microcella frigidaquae]|uniref:3-hydroxyisobutyrate dehydrogenase-like beta-hydroxyacid dehydrogenase n=1 Tax=Microcella frigidaquae TaxID=424758 RepID=A0A840XNL6_9MICO|nr:NAD(P)-dependent oxidoreductase [Microcella frigidaquae]MBB5618427.1 3-hydroxyisobutyrate dehydrogenase-like beta-hydroxyacid dehydrogenase [Microcella frigidaquae]NHN44670.1 NAD(P)-dependent oxidoreductase [Microcella frigidaquae]
MDTAPTRIGFLGLGAMGRGMTARLVDQGYAVLAWNRSAEPTEQLAAEHAAVTRADSVAAAFAGASVVHSMLTDDAVVLGVFSDELLAGIPAGRVHVNHATISPAAAAELAERHARHGVGYVSAPVLGRSTVAHTGALLVVASGDPDAIAIATPTMEALGARLWNLGTDPRLAAVVKIAVNYSILNALQSIAESVTLVEAGGIDPSTFVEILTHTAFSGSAHKGYGPIIAEKRYQPVGFAMSLGLKDLTLVEDAAAELGVALPVAPVLHELFEAALADPELAQLDWSAVAEITRRRRG